MPQIEVTQDVADKLSSFKIGRHKTDNDVIETMVEIVPAQNKRLRELLRAPNVSNNPAGALEQILRDLGQTPERESIQELFSGVRESLGKLAAVGPDFKITPEWHEQVYKPAIANAVRTFEAIGVALERTTNFSKSRH